MLAPVNVANQLALAQPAAKRKAKAKAAAAKKIAKAAAKRGRPAKASAVTKSPAAGAKNITTKQVRAARKRIGFTPLKMRARAAAASSSGQGSRRRISQKTNPASRPAERLEEYSCIDELLDMFDPSHAALLRLMPQEVWPMKNKHGAGNWSRQLAKPQVLVQVHLKKSNFWLATGYRVGDGMERTFTFGGWEADNGRVQKAFDALCEVATRLLQTDSQTS